MVNQRNRIIRLVDYIKADGIVVNIKKNKARGHRGLFMTSPYLSRIDISNKLTESEIFSVIVHEYAHYIHYKYDKNLNNLDFVFDNYNDDLREELIRITVASISKDYAKNLFEIKDTCDKKIKELYSDIKEYYPDIKLSQNCTKIENALKAPFKYLLKYDNILFNNIKYSIKYISNYNLFPIEEQYILLKSEQRKQKRIQARIRKINNYYNKPSELFARFLEGYFLNRENTILLAPNAVNIIDSIINNNSIPELTGLYNVLTSEL